MYRPPTDQQQQYVPTAQPFVPTTNQQQFVPVYQTAQSLLAGTSSWQPQNQAAQSFLPQLQPQTPLIPIFHHATTHSRPRAGPPGLQAPPTGIAASPAHGTMSFGVGLDIFRSPQAHSMPTLPDMENAQFVLKSSQSPKEKSSKSSRSTTPDETYLLQLSSKDFYSPSIQALLSKRHVQIDNVSSPSTPAAPVKPATTSTPATPAMPATSVIKSEPEILPAEVTVKPKSKRSLALDDEPFVPQTVKQEQDSDDDLYTVEDPEVQPEVQKTVTPPCWLTAAEAPGTRLTDGYVFLMLFSFLISYFSQHLSQCNANSDAKSNNYNANCNDHSYIFIR